VIYHPSITILVDKPVAEVNRMIMASDKVFVFPIYTGDVSSMPSADEFIETDYCSRPYWLGNLTEQSLHDAVMQIIDSMKPRETEFSWAFKKINPETQAQPDTDTEPHAQDAHP
jgi:hypothetical protein